MFCAELYSGYFSAGKRHGKGIQTYYNDVEIEGMWDNDVLQ